MVDPIRKLGPKDILLRPDLDGEVPRYGCASTQDAAEGNCGMDVERGLVRLPTH